MAFFSLGILGAIFNLDNQRTRRTTLDRCSQPGFCPVAIPLWIRSPETSKMDDADVLGDPCLNFGRSRILVITT